jgi:hypothetical protein
MFAHFPSRKAEDLIHGCKAFFIERAVWIQEVHPGLLAGTKVYKVNFAIPHEKKRGRRSLG